MKPIGLHIIYACFILHLSGCDRDAETDRREHAGIFRLFELSSTTWPNEVAEFKIVLNQQSVTLAQDVNKLVKLRKFLQQQYVPSGDPRVHRRRSDFDKCGEVQVSSNGRLKSYGVFQLRGRTDIFAIEMPIPGEKVTSRTFVQDLPKLFDIIK